MSIIFYEQKAVNNNNTIPRIGLNMRIEVVNITQQTCWISLQAQTAERFYPV